MGEVEQQRAARRRVALLLALLTVVFSLIGYRLVQLQVLSGDRFSAQALAQRLDRVPLRATRGSVFDRNGLDLAISVQQDSIWANPQVVTDPAATAARLAPLVGVDEATLAARLGSNRQFVYVARTVDDDVADAVRALDLPGIGFLPESRRHYPAGDLAAPVIGMVGLEGQGLTGLEYLYQDRLAGRDGEKIVERDRQGHEIPRTIQRDVPAEPGSDYVLTLDEALQHRVEQSLIDQVVATSARGGMAAVVDVRTGDILSMATVDGADGDGPARPASATERNRPLTDIFEPGSTNKLVTVSAALEHGVVGPWTPFDVPPSLQVADAVFRDSEFHPTERWSVAECLKESSNVCTIQIAQALGAARLDQALRDFGLGQPTSVEFPGQSAGLLLDPDHYYGTGLASVSIGYSVGVTAVQMLDAFATVANGGVTRPPRLVAAEIDGDGVRREAAIPAGRRVVSAQTAARVSEMLTGVVRGGTGLCAAVPGYTVAGKTGTSRKALDTGGYADGQYMASFIGFAPAEQPRLAAIVVIDQPDHAHRYGARSAAPVFSEIMQFGLRLERVVPPPASATPPQYEQARQAASDQGIDCSVPHGEPSGGEASAVSNPDGTAPAGTLRAATSPSA